MAYGFLVNLTALYTALYFKSAQTYKEKATK